MPLSESDHARLDVLLAKLAEARRALDELNAEVDALRVRRSEASSAHHEASAAIYAFLREATSEDVWV